MRSQFLLDPELAFLNNGSFGAMPKEILEHQDRIRREAEWEPIGFMRRAYAGGLRDALRPVARILGGDSAHGVFVENATAGINAVLRSWDFGPGDAILTTTHTYGAVLQTLRYVCGRSGAALIEVEVPFPIDGPDAVVEAVEASWVDGIRMAVFDHISSATGLVYPIEALVRLCRDRGALSLVDGAHVPGQIHVDLSGLGADFYVGNLHKWLYAPKGCAVLFMASAHRERVHPVVISHGYGDGLAAEFDWVGTRDLSAWLSAPSAVRFLEALGPERVRGWNHGLRREGAALLCSTWGTQAPAPDQMLAALATLDPPCRIPGDVDSAAAVERALFARHKIVVPVVPFGDRSWIRISAQIFNDLEDYERLARAIGPEGVR